MENLSAVLDNAIVIAAVIALALLCSLHAVIYQRDSRAAFAWLGFILLSPLMFSLMYLGADWRGVLVIAPLIGSISYLILGVNHLTRKFKQRTFSKQEAVFSEAVQAQVKPLLLAHPKWQGVFNTGESLGSSPVHFADIGLLDSGPEAYQAMLNAIQNAEKSITLFSYIFCFDYTGKQFCAALKEAANRGVAVRVMVDAVGSHLDLAQLQSCLAEANIPLASFMPVLFKTRFSNLRNHRKLLVIDANTAFTGGLNICDDFNRLEHTTEAKACDLHFQVRGRLVNYLQESFVHDWQFATQEVLDGPTWFDENLAASGDVLARVVADGPSFEEERLHWHFLNAINTASHSIKIHTPYFVPDKSLTDALCAAILRGVKVEIVVPQASDHSGMDYAMRGNLYELLRRGAFIYLQQGSFDHSKIFIVDDAYCSIGSANWDSRSLRLNYELNIETLNEAWAASLNALFATKKSESYLYTKAQWCNRPLWQKVRDGLARLFAPIL